MRNSLDLRKRRRLKRFSIFTGATAVDCIAGGRFDRVTCITEPGDTELAFGGGETINRLARQLGRRRQWADPER